MPLRILLIDTDPERARALEEKLSESGFAEILRAPDVPDLPRPWSGIRPDLIIIDMALPDRDALEDIRAVSAAHPIVMFTASDDPAFAEEAIAAGVCSYNLSGVALQRREADHGLGDRPVSPLPARRGRVYRRAGRCWKSAA